MSGLEILRLYARLKGVPLAECEQLLELVELQDSARHRVSTYSRGMCQRLGLAQALLGDPRLLILDEPTSGLDPFFRRTFYQLIRERQARGTTILLSSHSLTEIEAETDRIVILRQGGLVTQGSMDELRRQAELPVNVRITLKKGNIGGLTALGDAGFKVQAIDEHICNIRCHSKDKMALLRKVAVQHTDLVEDLDITPPGLDELFIHFAGKEATK
jgi:Cu-processing system ATP-binding protein